MNPERKRRFRRQVLATLFLATVTMLVLMATKSGANFSKGQWTFTTKPGPWGNLDCTHIAVEMPETFISLEDVKDLHAHWYFAGLSREQIITLFQNADMSNAELQTLTNHSKWETDSNGVWVSPPDDLVLAIKQPVRQKIYSTLAKSPENSSQYAPFAYRPELIPGLLKRSGLQEATVRKFHELLYPQGSRLLFADADVLVNHLPDENEKVRFLKTISRVSTLLVKLRIDEHTDIEPLVEYWSYGRRKKDIRALLESMAAVPGGTKIDVAHILPSFVRKRIYTYPDPESQTLTNQHCHWTSLNFLSDIPDERFADNSVVQQTVQRDFVQVTQNPQLGDVILFLDSGDVVHSATYIADDIVFTKNGVAANRPWIYMQLEDLRACYERPERSLTLVMFRRKPGFQTAANERFENVLACSLASYQQFTPKIGR